LPLGTCEYLGGGNVPPNLITRTALVDPTKAPELWRWAWDSQVARGFMEKARSEHPAEAGGNAVFQWHLRHNTAETPLSLCRAQSACVSLLDDTRKNVYWPAVAGQWACYLGAVTPGTLVPAARSSIAMFPCYFPTPSSSSPASQK
jgi:hypothetical protein